jgi:hypothetical protein
MAPSQWPVMMGLVEHRQGQIRLGYNRLTLICHPGPPRHPGGTLRRMTEGRGIFRLALFFSLQTGSCSLADQIFTLPPCHIAHWSRHSSLATKR